ncbi:collagen-binding domain-containing protein [Nocardioides sambongensis]|nr:collagen-binding domain-containing protein [Nocardioides sambongensis]
MLTPTNVTRASGSSALAAIVLVAVVVAAAAGALSRPTPAYAEPFINPMAAAGDFTVMTEGDAHFGNSEIEGSIATGGDFSFDDDYPILHSTGLTPPGYSLAQVDGDYTRLLVRGAFDDSTGQVSEVSSRNDTLAGQPQPADQLGFVKIGDLADLDVSERGAGAVWVADGPGGTEPGIYDPNQPYIADPDPATGSRVQLSDTGWDDYFAGIDNTDQTTTCLTGLEQTTTIEQGNDADDALIEITPGATNVVTVTPTSPIFGPGARILLSNPLSPDTTLVFKVTGAAGAVLDLPVFDAETNPTAENPNPIAPYTLWDLSSNAGSEVEITGELVSGSIYAPGVDLVLDPSSPFEGQIISETLVTEGGEEIHHYAFEGTIDCGQPTTTPPTTPTTPTTPPPPPPRRHRRRRRHRSPNPRSRARSRRARRPRPPPRPVPGAGRHRRPGRRAPGHRCADGAAGRPRGRARPDRRRHRAPHPATRRTRVTGAGRGSAVVTPGCAGTARSGAR